MPQNSGFLTFNTFCVLKFNSGENSDFFANYFFHRIYEILIIKVIYEQFLRKNTTLYNCNKTEQSI